MRQFNKGFVRKPLGQIGSVYCSSMRKTLSSRNIITCCALFVAAAPAFSADRMSQGEPRAITVRSARSITTVTKPVSAKTADLKPTTVTKQSDSIDPIEAPLPPEDQWTPVITKTEPKVIPRSAKQQNPFKLDSQPEPTPKVSPPVQKPKKVDTRDEFAKLIDKAIEVTSQRPLSTKTNTPWQIAHGALALRQNYQIEHEGKLVNTFSWISTGPSFNNKPWFLITPYGGKGHPYTERYEFEGHPNQFLALFSLARLPRDYSFQVGNRKITIDDMIRNAKMEVNNREEIAWTLWTLAYYEPSDASWINKEGQRWSIEYLVKLQMSKPVVKSACGGMHGLFAIASARNAYLQTGKPLRGTWLEAHMHLRKHIEMARWGRNRDGSFSSKYFRSRGYTNSVKERLSTTGHTLEFLMVAVPASRLSEPWIKNAAARIATDLIASRNAPRELDGIGGMYHALHSLILYRERTRPEYLPQPTDQPQSVEIADGPESKAVELRPTQQPGKPAGGINPKRHARRNIDGIFQR